MSYEPGPNAYNPPPQQAYGGQPGYDAGGYAQPGYAQPGYGAGGYPGYGAGGYPGYGAAGYALPPEIAPLPGASMGEAVKRFFNRYAQFRGCASLSEYWWVVLALLLAEVLGGIVIGVIAAVVAAASGDPEAAAGVVAVGYILLVVAALGVLVPNIAVAVRRLHDAGYSGLFYLLVLVPFGSIALLVLLCMPSKPERFRPEWG